MSLLMNALKKAERKAEKAAKNPSQPDADIVEAPGSESNRNLAQELGLDPQPARSTAGTDFPRGNNAPDSPMLRPMELALEPEPARVPEAVQPSNGTLAKAAVHGKDGGAAGRSSARTVFAAKKAPAEKSKKPFYAVVGVSCLATAGYGAYLWNQMYPSARPILSSAAPAASRPALQAQPAQSAPAFSSPQPAASIPAEQEPLKPSLPAAETESTALASQSGETPTVIGNRREPESGRSAATSNRDAKPSTLSGPTASLRATAKPRDVASAAGGPNVESPANLQITRNANRASVNPDVLAGYAALQAGDLDRAGQSYDRALQSEPANRDAMLGAATVLLRLDRTDAAEAYFRQLLRLHPNDSYATAQLAALTARGDPVGALSQVNSLIARETERPENSAGGGTLAFVQGNQLAAQGRWPEAQQAYFNAHRADPGNADYCYNLAISLDRIREPRLARDYYRKAIDLSKGRITGFDVARAQTRLDQINGSLK